MRQGTRTTLLALGVIFLLAYAWTPLFRAGLVAEDVAALVGTDGAEPTPVARLSLALSRSLWGLGDGVMPPALGARIEGFLLLVFAAVGMGLFVRRLLLPWTGSEHAAAGGFATALILSVHPLSISAVGELGARGELWALVLGAWSGAAFLRGRQDRRKGFTVLAAVLCAVGGFAAHSILGLPLLLAGAELASAHRYRPKRVRLRTAATTLLVFGAAAGIDLVLRVGRLGPGALPPGMRAWTDAGSESELTVLFTAAVEKLGLLILPANPFVLGVMGTAMAGSVFLVAMQPALSAARTAPRLWGWMLFAWFLALTGSEVLHPHVRVSPANLTDVRVLLPSAAVMSIGLALAATAMSGLRRYLVPLVVAVGYAAIAHGNALPWRRAAQETEALREDLVRARELFGTQARFFVVDPPRDVAGVEPVGAGVAALLHPELDDAEGSPPRVHGLTREAFLAWSGQAEFAALRRAETIVLLVPDASLADVEPVARPTRRILRLPAPRDSSTGRSSWRGDPSSPALDLDPLTVTTLRVEAPSGTDVDARLFAGWSTRESPAGESSVGGVWSVRGDEPVCVFDLGGDLAWKLGGRVRILRVEGGLPRLRQAEVLEQPPSIGPGVRPTAVGDDWRFEKPPAGWGVDPERGSFVVTLLDLATYEYVELPAELRPSGRVRIDGAAARVAALIRRTGGPVAWSLDCRIEGKTVAQSRGRRVADG